MIKPENFLCYSESFGSQWTCLSFTTVSARLSKHTRIAR